MGAQLMVVQGKQRGMCLLFPVGEFVFGRGPECHVRSDSELVSRQHCMIAVDQYGVQVRDLGSTNGTLVNGNRVIGEQTLNDGDFLQLGAVVLEVKVIPEKVAQETISDGILLPQGATLNDATVAGKSTTPSMDLPQEKIPSETFNP